MRNFIKSLLFVCIALIAISSADLLKLVSASAIPVKNSAFFISASVIRSDDSHKLTISWENTGNLGDLKIYVSTNPDKPMITLLKTVKPGTNSTKGSVTIEDPTPGYRAYYYLSSSKGPHIIVSERMLPLKGVANARDLGGYKTSDGKYVKWGYLFRTSALDGITADDIISMNRMDVKTIIDLRRTSEIQNKPDINIPLMQHYNINLYGDDQTTKMMKLYPNYNWDIYLKNHDQMNADEIENYLLMYYEFAVNDSTVQYGEKQFFAFMLSNDKPVIWHCTYGKDRTGIMTALFLYSLGVPKETIINDYLLTNQSMQNYFPDKYKSMGKELFTAAYGVKAEYLTTFFDGITVKYGSIDSYLSKVCGVNNTVKAELKAKYLQD